MVLDIVHIIGVIKLSRTFKDKEKMGFDSHRDKYSRREAERRKKLREKEDSYREKEHSQDRDEEEYNF